MKFTYLPLPTGLLFLSVFVTKMRPIPRRPTTFLEITRDYIDTDHENRGENLPLSHYIILLLGRACRLESVSI